MVEHINYRLSDIIAVTHEEFEVKIDLTNR